MIFERLFRPACQHPDAGVRLQALHKLDQDKAEHKSQLHELAFNDANTGVRLAALEKLDSFAIWWKLAQTDTNDRIRKVARQRTEATLLDRGNAGLSCEQRRIFIQQCSNPGLLETLLLSQWQHESDTELSLSILNKLNKNRLIHSVVFSSRNKALPRALLEDIEDARLLSRISKKHADPQLVSMAQKKLDEMAQQHKRAEHTDKAARLLLSKLMALKQHSDVASLRQHRDALQHEFDALALSALLPVVRQELTQKYAQLCQQLAEIVERLERQH